MGGKSSKDEIKKIYDTDHGTYLFVGHDVQDKDHTVYTCSKDAFDKNTQNFETRTPFVIHPLGNSTFQIYDYSKKAYLFVGHSKDQGNDHTVYASEQPNWQDQNDFNKRTTFAFEKTDKYKELYRIKDVDHNAFLFVGNSKDNSGDHTLYAVPQDKFFNNQNEWGRRTIFELQ